MTPSLEPRTGDQTTAAQPSIVSVAVGILVSCCLSALLLSSLI